MKLLHAPSWPRQSGPRRSAESLTVAFGCGPRVRKDRCARPPPLNPGYHLGDCRFNTTKQNLVGLLPESLERTRARFHAMNEKVTIAPVDDVGDRPEGFIFDLDGTLVDNMRIHREAFQRFSEVRRLPPLGDAAWERLDGKRNRDIFPILFDRALDEDELRTFAWEKESLYRALSLRRLTPLAGLERLLARLADRGVRWAIATSAPAENVDHTLSALGLRERFPLVVRSDQVARGKPHPDVYLAAADRLQLAPEACVGFEDTPAGVTAVVAAGMTCVAVTTTMTAGALQAHGAEPHHTVADYDEYLAGPGNWLA